MPNGIEKSPYQESAAHRPGVKACGSCDPGRAYRHLATTRRQSVSSGLRRYRPRAYLRLVPMRPPLWPVTCRNSRDRPEHFYAKGHRNSEITGVLPNLAGAPEGSSLRWTGPMRILQGCHVGTHRGWGLATICRPQIPAQMRGNPITCPVPRHCRPCGSPGAVCCPADRARHGSVPDRSWTG